jgi:hypothetical protein
LGVRPKLLHLATETSAESQPDWFWSGLLAGDLSHSEVFDNAKIRRYVPAFNPTRFFEREIYKILAWRRANPQFARADPAEAAVAARLVRTHARLQAALAGE